MVSLKNGNSSRKSCWMKTESKNLFERQASWQKTRKKESWAEKLRKSAQARDSLRKFIKKEA